MAGKSNESDAHAKAVEAAREQIRAELIEKQGGKSSKSSSGKKKFSVGTLIIGLMGLIGLMWLMRLV